MEFTNRTQTVKCNLFMIAVQCLYVSVCNSILTFFLFFPTNVILAESMGNGLPD